jgi:hypothetical protein
MCYNLICIFVCTPICTKNLFLQKVGVTSYAVICGVLLAPHLGFGTLLHSSSASIASLSLARISCLDEGCCDSC